MKHADIRKAMSKIHRTGGVFVDNDELRKLEWSSSYYYRAMDERSFDYTRARGEFDEEYFLEVLNVGAFADFLTTILLMLHREKRSWSFSIRDTEAS
jgi:hypothetical protein